HYVVRISSGDKLACHSRNVPAQEWPAQPRNNACQPNASINKRTKTVIREIFIEMLSNFTGATQRGQDIDKPKQLHLELLVAHGDRHSSLIQSRLAQKRLWMLIDQLEDAAAAPVNFVLDGRHLRN